MNFCIVLTNILLLECALSLSLALTHCFMKKLSYLFIFDDTSKENVMIMVGSIVSSVLWLHCSLIYVGAFFYCPEAKNVKIR